MPAGPATPPRSTCSRSAPTPRPCQACEGELRRRWSRVAVKYQGWGFTSTDKLVGDDRRNQDFRALRDRAERIANGE